MTLAQTKSSGWLANLEKLGLSSEQREYLEAMTNANDPDIQQLNAIYAQTDNLDPSNMNADEMRQYSESVAQAADVVNSENDKPAKASSKTLSSEDKEQADLDAKQAIVS